MSKAFAEFLVGLTVMVGLAGVAVLLLMFGEFAGARQPVYTVMLELNDASGLSRSSGVTLNGVQVGAIRGIRSAPDPRGGVVIDLHIFKGTRIPRDVSVSLERGLVGEATLAMRTRSLAPGEPDPGYLAEGETLRVDATGMLDQITSLLDRKLGSISEAVEGFRRLMETLEEAGERLNDALAHRLPDDVDSGAAPPNLVSTVARFDAAVRDARAWLGDDAMRGDARQSLAELRSFLDRASQAVDSWTTAADALTRNADALGEEGAAALREFAAASRALHEAIAQVQELAGRINRGEGTAGLLVTNPDLYRSLNDAAVRLERALTEAQLLFEKYRKEGLPLRF